MCGQTIDLYLMNGTADGIVRARLSNWSGVAYKIPYAAVKDCNINKIHQPGVYFLFGEDEDGLTCYVGESDDTLNRLKQHLNDSDPWKTAVAFLSDELDTTRILFIEDMSCNRLRRCKRCKVLTRQTTNQHKNDELEDFAKIFLRKMMVVLPALGYPVLDPTVKSSEIKQKEELYLDVAGIKAKGAETSDGFAVFVGSKVTLNPASTLAENAKRKREELFNKKIIQGDTFVDNYVFNSSTEAAEVVMGYTVSGPMTWRYEDGTTLKDSNARAAAQSEQNNESAE